MVTDQHPRSDRPKSLRTNRTSSEDAQEPGNHCAPRFEVRRTGDEEGLALIANGPSDQCEVSDYPTAESPGAPAHQHREERRRPVLRRREFLLLPAPTALAVAGMATPAQADAPAPVSPPHRGIPPLQVEVTSLGVPVTELAMNVCAASHLPDGSPVLYVQGGTPGNPVQFAALDPRPGGNCDTTRSQSSTTRCR